MLTPAAQYMQARADQDSAKIGAQLNANADRIAANRAMQARHQQNMARINNERNMLAMQQNHEKDMFGKKSGLLHGLLKRL